MRISRMFYTSQLDFYRIRNLKYIGKKKPKNPKDDIAEICEAAVDAIKMASSAIGHIDLRGYMESLRDVKDELKEAAFRNTSPDEMDASKFDMANAMKAFSKLKEVNKKATAANGKRQYSTMAIGVSDKIPCGHTQTEAAPVLSCRRATTAEWNRNYDRRRFASGTDGLMINMASGAAKEAAYRYIQGERGNLLQQSMKNDENMKLLVDCLCKMRGTALKFGQLLSLQYGILPETMRKALISVRHRADIMGVEQINRIMATELGQNWREMFQEFELHPMASASLGQVHRAVTKDGKKVCVKIQFPGIGDSIDSDISNIMFLCTKTNLIPQNLFLKHFAAELKVELTSECNYNNEANFYKIFKQLTLDGFMVPNVIDEMSTKRIITVEFVPGVPIEDCKHLPQSVRDSIGKRLMQLSLSEIFLFGLMNTDPNPSNYLYDQATDLIGLIDFGSCRSYNQKFVADYYKLVQASVEQDLEKIRHLSYKMRFLNDQDSEEMVQHHVESVLITGEPFRHEGLFDFGASDIIQQCRKKASIILKIRKQPPPPEVYSLHRKLAGCYVICQLIGARVNAHDIFKEISALR
ncbi:ADCK3-like domain containing protein [Babesia gibsoni]|uniref:ADCK3-like domain containing protein n=1 Tax=Babesia gibsoni TaxID=33632 RepID=A0AAD8UTC0_BABGI|nr:ADCK3-like domain containing protein [Babesia gibsoni]